MRPEEIVSFFASRGYRVAADGELLVVQRVSPGAHAAVVSASSTRESGN